jgi:hypothetical protein
MVIQGGGMFLMSEVPLYVPFFKPFARRGVPRSSELPHPQEPTVALFLGTYGDPRGVGISCERGTPVLPILGAVCSYLELFFD